MKRLFFISILSLSLTKAFCQCEEKSVSKSTVARFVRGDAKEADMPIEATISIDKGVILVTLTMGRSKYNCYM